MAQLDHKFKIISFANLLPRSVWKKLGEVKKKKMRKRLNNLEVPSDWKHALIHKLECQDYKGNCPCCAGSDQSQIHIRLLSPVRRRRSENYFTSTPINKTYKSIKSMPRVPMMLQVDLDRMNRYQEPLSPGFKIYDVMDEKFKDRWGVPREQGTIVGVETEEKQDIYNYINKYFEW